MIDPNTKEKILFDIKHRWLPTDEVIVGGMELFMFNHRILQWAARECFFVQLGRGGVNACFFLQ